MLDDTQIDVNLPAVHGDGGCRAAQAVVGQQVSQRQRCQHVAVGYQERLVQPVHQRQRPGCAQRRILIAVADAQTQPLTIAEEKAQQFGQMADSQHRLVDTGPLHLPQQNLQDRHVADGHQRLG